MGGCEQLAEDQDFCEFFVGGSKGKVRIQTKKSRSFSLQGCREKVRTRSVPSSYVSLLFSREEVRHHSVPFSISIIRDRLDLRNVG